MKPFRAAASSTSKKRKKPDDDDDIDGSVIPTSKDVDSEVDPLDAFMESVSAEVNASRFKSTDRSLPRRGDVDEKDDMETLLEKFDSSASAKALASSTSSSSSSSPSPAMSFPGAHLVGRRASSSRELQALIGDLPGLFVQELRAAEGGGAMIVRDRRFIESLPPVNHSQIAYAPFVKSLYSPSGAVAQQTTATVSSWRQSNEVRIVLPDGDVAEDIFPVYHFEHFGFDQALCAAITAHGYESPTVIQSQAIPVILSGCDLITLSKTGSGKTAAFALPMIAHILAASKRPGRKEGPTALCLAPTRELAEQILKEVRKFSKFHGLRVVAIFGGVGKGDQRVAMQQGADIVVATPGRLIDSVKSKLCSLRHCTFLVLDEADRMFEMGFEAQVRSICNQVRPDRQTLLFSATFKRRLEQLAASSLHRPYRIYVGQTAQEATRQQRRHGATSSSAAVANQDVTQVVEIVRSHSDKFPWLVRHLHEFVHDGSVLIFVASKLGAQELSTQVNRHYFSRAPSSSSSSVPLLRSRCIHGDMAQSDRNAALRSFRQGDVQVLVATDLVSRGIDIAHIRTVLNYDAARDLEAHTHRIGRTGRAGNALGMAYTLLTRKETRFAAALLPHLRAANQDIPEELVQLAHSGDRRMPPHRNSSSHFIPSSSPLLHVSSSFSSKSKSTSTPSIGSFSTSRSTFGSAK